jgi:hypothetical protein
LAKFFVNRIPSPLFFAALFKSLSDEMKITAEVAKILSSEDE